LIVIRNAHVINGFLDDEHISQWLAVFALSSLMTTAAITQTRWITKLVAGDFPSQDHLLQ
jgi:hypothetical protein